VTCYEVLGLEEAAGADEVFRQLVLARVIEPTSKADSLRVLDETGVIGPSYPTLNRCLSRYAKPGFRQALSRACASHAKLGSASLVRYDVSTLHFETDTGDGFPAVPARRFTSSALAVPVLTAGGSPKGIDAIRLTCEALETGCVSGGVFMMQPIVDFSDR
jgi:hypothetical protein